MRLWDSEGKRWSKSVVEMGFEVLVVSQFTLYAVLNGTKPDFHESMGSETSRPFFEKVVARFRALYDPSKIQSPAPPSDP